MKKNFPLQKEISDLQGEAMIAQEAQIERQDKTVKNCKIRSKRACENLKEQMMKEISSGRHETG